VHTNLMVPSRCITPLPIRAPHSSQIIICPSGDATSTTTLLYHLNMLLYKIKNMPLYANYQRSGVITEVHIRSGAVGSKGGIVPIVENISIGFMPYTLALTQRVSFEYLLELKHPLFSA
jgi:hypothetical protein